jgi:hypothetical protein
MAFLEPQNQPGYAAGDLCLDIDFIEEWIKNENSFEFQVTPATLLFEHAWNIQLDIDSAKAILIDNISYEAVPINELGSNYSGPEQYRWTLECHQGQIRIDSPSIFFEKRMKQVKLKTQHIPLDQRGGISFGRNY